MSNTPAKRKLAAVTSDWQADKSQVKNPRKRGNPTLECQKAKALNDHCRYWTHEQMHVRVLEGKTFTEHLEKQLADKSRGEASTGALFWSTMEAAFGDPDGDEHPALDFSRLDTDIESLSVYEEFAIMLPPDYNRQAIGTWSKCCTTLSEGEAMILVSALKRLKPSSPPDHYQVGMSILRALHRHGVGGRFPGLICAVHKRIDSFLQELCEGIYIENFLLPSGHPRKLVCEGIETLRLYSETGVDPKLFVEENADCIYLILNKASCDELLSLDSACPLSTKRTLVCEITSSSVTARKLFSSSLRGLARQEVDELVTAAAQKLLLKRVTRASLAEALTECKTKLGNVAGIDLVARREVQLPYRGVSLTFEVKNPERHAELALNCAVRASAVSAGLVTTLAGEGSVCSDHDAVAVAIDEDLLAPAKRCRNQLARVVAEMRRTEKKSNGGDDLKVWVRVTLNQARCNCV
eukprot:6459574-Amphidinium_carterae.1